MRPPKVIGIVPARGGSKGVPRKNIRPLGGKPLLYYTVTEAIACGELDRIIVSTEDSEIARIARGYGAEVVDRPPELARDDTPSIPVLRHVVEHLERSEHYVADVVVILQPTSPFRTAEDIRGGIRKYSNNVCDSVVGVCPVEHPPQWIYRLDGERMAPFLSEPRGVTRRQDATPLYRLNGAIYVVGAKWLVDKDQLIGDNSLALLMPPERSLDIDTEMDMAIAEAMLKLRSPG